MLKLFASNALTLGKLSNKITSELAKGHCVKAHFQDLSKAIFSNSDIRMQTVH
jgi:hypothetical protein